MHPLLERKSRRMRPRGVGAFARVAVPPHGHPENAIKAELQASLMGDPGIRLAKSTGRRTYKAGLLSPQRFTARTSEINEANEIRASSAKLNTRRALGRSRRGR